MYHMVDYPLLFFVDPQQDFEDYIFFSMSTSQVNYNKHSLTLSKIQKYQILYNILRKYSNYIMLVIAASMVTFQPNFIYN